MKYNLFAVLLVLATSALGSWEQDFNDLKHRPGYYEDTGALCEELAKLKFERALPNSNFEVVAGIEYGDSQLTIGELDILIYDRSKNSFTQVSEVKCWKDMNAGLEKAKDQINRFLRNLNSGKKQIFFQSTTNQQRYDATQFSDIKLFSTLGQKGSKTAGYDDELEYDLRELKKLGMEMLRCQDRGECEKPK
jgi:hypothetical protein